MENFLNEKKKKIRHSPQYLTYLENSCRTNKHKVSKVTE